MGKKLSKVKKTDNYEVAQNQVDDDDDDEEEAFSGGHLKKNKEKTSVNLDKMMDERRAEAARQSTSQDAPRAKIHKQPNVPEEEGGS